MPEMPLIAVVDDEESVNVAVSSLLRSLGFRTACFGSAEDFLHATVAAAFACVISDVHMPGMSGLELAQKLRVEAPEIPVILMSALPLAPIETRARECGVLALLSKPFSLESLQQGLDRAFGRFG